MVNLPNDKHREKYIEAIKKLEQDLRAISSEDEISDLSLHTLQQKLDTVASTYQDDERIGTARYKLYELQAYIHHFEQRDDAALAFINHAIELRGGSYQRAEKLIAALSPSASNETTRQSTTNGATMPNGDKKLNGLEGWLALFIVGQIIAFFITLFNFFQDGFMSSSDVTIYNEYQAGLGDTIQTLSTLESLSLIVAMGLIITTLVLLFRRRKLAKAFAIATLTFFVVYSLVDYAVVSSVFQSSGLAQYSEINAALDKVGSTIGRNIVAALIWVPYFLVSKRVKTTLVK